MTNNAHPTRILTAGFTQKTAREFFTNLQQTGAKRLIDVRLNNTSQLSGFAKKDDLAYFLEAILHIQYLHLPVLAPTQEMLDSYKTNKSKNPDAWPDYEKHFLDLMSARQIERHLDPKILHDACLLCSEEKPHHCHRRLVAEYLRAQWPAVQIEHLP